MTTLAVALISVGGALGGTLGGAKHTRLHMLDALDSDSTNLERLLASEQSQVARSA
ncbi:hypothetical protein [Streptomyces sp. NPDC048411]|uniref:hypothetical protein n=1 Tax=Streptomyces sp. NPDC048411 TaxID=3157206 RepID=UPI0034548A9D